MFRPKLAWVQLMMGWVEETAQHFWDSDTWLGVTHREIMSKGVHQKQKHKSTSNPVKWHHTKPGVVIAETFEHLEHDQAIPHHPQTLSVRLISAVQLAL